MRRVGQVVLAIAAVAAVAVLARPAQPQPPPSFEVERETPAPEPVDSEAEPSGGRAGGGLVVHRFDRRTLATLAAPAEVPLEADTYVETDVSPDGRFLAVLQQLGPDDPGSLLEIYRTYRLDAPIDTVRLPAGVSQIAFTPDSTQVVWATRGPEDGVTIGARRIVADVRARRVPPVTLAPGLTLLRMRPLGSARVGLQVHDPSVPAGSTRLLVADLAGGEVTVDLVLPASGDFHAGVAWAPERDLAFVAPADREAVLLFDLGTGEQAAELALPRNARPRAGEGVRAAWRDAVLSPDGGRLYVHGEAVPAVDDSGAGGERAHALPLLVVDVEAGAIEAVDGVPGWVAAVSRDGSRVALVSASGAPGGPEVLRLLAGPHHEQRWEHEATSFTGVSFTPDGRHLLCVLHDPGPGGGGRTRLALLDASDGSLLRSRDLDGDLWRPHLEAGLLVELDTG